MSSRLQAAGAGAAAATVWGLLEQVDQRLLRCDYSDIAVLGKAVTRGPHWRLTGFWLCTAVNGVLLRACLGRAPWPATDEPAPACREPGACRAPHALPALLLRRPVPPGARRAGGSAAAPESPGAFAQATWRHAGLGTVLGRLTGSPPVAEKCW